MTGEKLMLLGCGVLRKEISRLIAKNGWPLDMYFLDSALHCGDDKLCQVLQSALAAHQGSGVIVFCGCCHPRLEPMLAESGTFRTDGLNCLEMLLGSEAFNAELVQGAYFLLEEWARNWLQRMELSFGTRRLEVIAEIFQADRKYLLGLRTPCSGDFTAEAEANSRMAGLPLRWRDVPLDHLEFVLQAAVAKRRRTLPCQTKSA